MALEHPVSAEAPVQLRAVAAKVEARLERLFDEQLTRWRTLDPRLAEAVEELALVARTGGKRLRAAFCYWSWRGCLGSVNSTWWATAWPRSHRS